MKKPWIPLVLFCIIFSCISLLPFMHSEANRDASTLPKLIDRGWELYNRKMYQQALELFNKVIEGAPGEWSGYYGAGVQLATMNKFDAAMPLLHKADQLSDIPYIHLWLGFCYEKTLDRVRALLYYEKSMLGYRKHGMKPLAWGVINQVQLYMAKRDFDSCTALALSLKDLGYSDKELAGIRANLDPYLSAWEYWKNNYDRMKRSVYEHRIQIIIFRNTEISTQDAGNRWSSISCTVPDDFIKSHEGDLELLKIMYFYLTDGKMIISCDTKSARYVDHTVKIKVFLNGRITGAGGFFTGQLQWDTINSLFESAYPALGDIFFESRNKYDTILRIWNTEGSQLQCYGWSSPLPYIHNKFISSARRGTIIMSTEWWNSRILIHEFFHACEFAYDDIYLKKGYVLHQYEDAYRKKWPRWYHGEGELFFYENIFSRVFAPKTYEGLFFRNQVETLTPEEYAARKK